MRRHRPRLLRTVLPFLLAAAGPVAASAAEPVDTAQAAADVDALMEQGKEQYRAGQYAEAVATFEAVLAADATVLNAHRGLGRSLEKLDRYADAEKAYTRMRASFPDEPESLYRLGIVYRKLSRYEESVEAYRAFSQARPDDPDPWYGMGESLRELGDAAGAIAAYQRYVELEKRPEEQRYVERAKEHIATLEASAAAPVAEAPVAPTPPEVVAEAPVLPDKAVHTPEAEAPARPEPAAPVLDGAEVRAASDVAEAMAAGDLSFAAGNYVHAAGRYNAAQLAAPGEVAPAYKLGVALAAAGDLGGAIDAWELALDARPGFEPAQRNIERAQRRLAVDAVLDVEALTGDAAARGTLARDYLSEGRFQMALRAARALLELAPADAQAHRLAALAHLGLADAASALVELETELALQPADARIYRSMAEAHEILEQPEQAIYFYELYLSSAAAASEPVPSDEIRARIEALGGSPAPEPAAPEAPAGEGEGEDEAPETPAGPTLRPLS